jgi:hypothetical protein
MKNLIQMGRRVLGRLHVITALLVFGFVVWSGSLCSVRGGELPAASGLHWKAAERFVAKPNATAPVKVELKAKHCTLGPFPVATVVPGGVAVGTPTVCGDLDIIDVPETVDASALLVFDDGVTHNSYPVRALDWITGASERVAPIVNANGTGTWINTYAEKPSTVTAKVYDGDGEAIGFETYDVPTGWFQRRIAARTEGGSVVLSVGCGALACAAQPPIIAFAAVTEERGGNADVREFEPAAPVVPFSKSLGSLLR